MEGNEGLFEFVLKGGVPDPVPLCNSVPEVDEKTLRRLQTSLDETKAKRERVRKWSMCVPSKKTTLKKLSLRIKKLKKLVGAEKNSVAQQASILQKHVEQLEASRKQECEHLKEAVAIFQAERDQAEQAVCDACSEFGDAFVHVMVVDFMQERAKVDMGRKPADSNWADRKKLNGRDRGERQGRCGLLGMKEKAAKTLEAATEGTDGHEEARWNFKFFDTIVNTVHMRMDCTSKEVTTPVCELGEEDRREGVHSGLLQDVTETDSFFVVFASLVIMHYIYEDIEVPFCSVEAARLIDEAAHANQERCDEHGQVCRDRFMAIQSGGEEVPAKDGEGTVFRKYFVTVEGPDGWHAFHSMAAVSEFTGVRKRNIWNGLHEDEDRTGFNVQNDEGTNFRVMCWDTDDQTYQWMLDYPMPGDDNREDYAEGLEMVIEDADEEFFLEGDSVLYQREDGETLLAYVVDTQPSENGPVYTLRMPDGQKIEDVPNTHVKTKEEEEEECAGIMLKEEEHPQDETPVGAETDDDEDEVTSEECVQKSFATFRSFTRASQDEFVLDMSEEKPIHMTYLRHHLVSQYTSVEELMKDVKELKRDEEEEEDTNWKNMLDLINCAVEMWTPPTAH